jgi:hypothetical protein
MMIQMESITSTFYYVVYFQNDFLKLASDDEFGRKLQDLELLGNGKVENGN